MPDLVSVAIGSGLGILIARCFDIFLEKQKAEIEKKRWLMNAKLEAYTDLTKEIISLGFNSEIHDNKGKFQAIASTAYLLIDDSKLRKEVQEQINNVVNFNTDFIKIESDIPQDLLKDYTDKQMSREEINRAVYAGMLIEKSFKITELLKEDLVKT